MGNISSGFDLIDKVTKKQVFGEFSSKLDNCDFFFYTNTGYNALIKIPVLLNFQLGF